MIQMVTVLLLSLVAGFGFGLGLALVWEVIIRAGGTGRFISLTVCRVQSNGGYEG